MSEYKLTSRGCTILVDLNVASHIDPSVSAATTLAAAVGAVVLGLFIEEDSLLDLAALPCSRAYSIGGTEGVALSPAAMLNAFERHAKMSRKLLSREARKASVEWSFRAERGDLQQKIRGALSHGDFLVIGANGHGSLSRQVVDNLNSSPPGTRGIVVTRSGRGYAAKGSVVVIVDADSLDHVALAARIASVRQVSLQLLVLTGSIIDLDRLTDEVRELIGQAQQLSVFQLLPNSRYTIAAALKRIKPSFVVAGPLFEKEQDMLSLSRAANAPLLLLNKPT